MFLFVVISTAAAIYWGRKYWLWREEDQDDTATEMEEMKEEIIENTDSRIRQFLAEEYEALRRPHTQRCVALILQQVAETRRLQQEEAEDEVNSTPPQYTDPPAPLHPQGPPESLSSGIVDMTGIVEGASGVARAASSI